MHAEPALRRAAVLAGLATLAVVGLAVAGCFTLVGEGLVALAVACVVPLGVALAADVDPAGRPRPTARVAAALLPPGVALGLASFVPTPGALAAALAAGWLVATLAVAAAGAARLARRGAGPIEELAVDAGHLFLPVGAAWLLASRAGAPLLGFREPVVLYTAAHFHYAGFAAPLVAGLAGRALALRRAPSDRASALASPRTARAYALSTLVVLLGVPLVAAGITFGRALELPPAALLSAGMLGTMAWLARVGVARLRRGHRSGALLVASGLALTLSMALATAFAATGSATRGAAAPLIPYATMAAVHGTTNAIAFAVCALVAFAALPPPRGHDPFGASWPRLFGRGFIGVDFFDRAGAVDPARVVEGQLGSLDDFAHAGFDPARVHPLVRDFYERTARYDLRVTPTWHAPFALGGRAFACFARRALGQVVLPTAPEGDAVVTTRLFALREELDGRPGARGYVRAYGRGADARANFVAAYATHQGADARYLSAAFPLPGGALVAVLRFDDGEAPGSLAVTSHPRPGEGAGDEGMFVVTPLGALRLPVDERIEVWVDAAGALRARHRTRVLGLAAFTLAYAIARAPGAGYTTPGTEADGGGP